MKTQRSQKMFENILKEGHESQTKVSAALLQYGVEEVFSEIKHRRAFQRNSGCLVTALGKDVLT